MSHPLRLALIGCGGFMRHHVGILSKLPLNIVALSDTDPIQLDLMRAAYPALAGIPAFADYRELLGKDLAEAVLISTPHTQHRQQILDCFGAGCHVLADKPLVTTVAHAYEVLQARDASGCVGAISYQRHGTGVFRWIKEVISSRRYGEIRVVNSHLGQQWLQLTKGSWRQDKALSGGGQLNDSGSHMIDVLLWATGLAAKKVSAFMDNCGTEVDINSVVNVEFTTGAFGSLSVVGDAALWHERHAIWLEEAALFLADNQIHVVERGGLRYTVDHFPADVTPEENFLRAIENGDEVLAPFECGLRTIELTEAAWRSAEQGGAVVEVGA